MLAALKAFWERIVKFIRYAFGRPPLPPGSIQVEVKGVAPGTPTAEAIQDRMNADHVAMINFMCRYIIPDSKIQKVQDYAKELRTKYPDMKPDRVFRKVAEEYRLKPIDFGKHPGAIDIRHRH